MTCAILSTEQNATASHYTSVGYVRDEVERIFLPPEMAPAIMEEWIWIAKLIVCLSIRKKDRRERDPIYGRLVCFSMARRDNSAED